MKRYELWSTRLELGAISSEKNFFFPNNCTAFDGIVGMQGDASLPAMLVADGAPDVFAMHECRSEGTLWLGGYDSTVTTGTLTSVDMPDDYTIDLTDVAIAGTSVGLAASAYGQALVDSGGPTIFLPQAAYDTLTTDIAANSTFTTAFGSAGWFAGTNCATPSMTKAELDAALPELGLTFGSATIQLHATDSYLMTYDGTPTAYCPALAASSSFLDLGNTLIRSQIVVFDRTHRQLGLAPTTPCI